MKRAELDREFNIFDPRYVYGGKKGPVTTPVADTAADTGESRVGHGQLLATEQKR
jgi:hypothetical protein